MTDADALIVGGEALGSRLFLGTGGFPSLEVLREALAASGAHVATVALRRVDPAMRGSVIDVLDAAGVRVLPNTAGCYTARDAVLTAHLAREAFATDWVKLDVIGDARTLLPDAPEPRGPPEQLVAVGFGVLPDTAEDRWLARRVAGVGGSPVMPLGSP